MYYTMRNAVPEFFADRDVNRPELKEVMDVVWVSIININIGSIYRLI